MQSKSCAARTHRTDRAGRVVITDMLPTAHTRSIGLEVKKLNPGHALMKSSEDCRSSSATQQLLLQATTDQLYSQTNMLPSTARMPSSSSPSLHARIDDHASAHFNTAHSTISFSSATESQNSSAGPPQFRAFLRLFNFLLLRLLCFHSLLRL